MRPPDSGASGLLVVDKSPGWTSHDVVARVRRIAETRRVGHTGTLDPMATGVLVLCLGKATRLIPYIEDMGGVDAKEYEAKIRFGFETSTDDALGERRDAAMSSAGFSAATLTRESVATALAAFVGQIQQLPPVFSAKKIGGRRAYALARRGEEVHLQPVAVHVGAAELLELRGDCASVRFACSRGTYVRALARDLGRSLGIGAHLLALRRTRSGFATLDRAIHIEDASAQSVQRDLIPMMSVLERWPRVTANEREVADLRLGRGVTLGQGVQALATRVRVGDGHGELVALAQMDGARIQPFCVF